jgi:hypothetical protein
LISSYAPLDANHPLSEVTFFLIPLLCCFCSVDSFCLADIFPLFLFTPFFSRFP